MMFITTILAFGASVAAATTGAAMAPAAQNTTQYPGLTAASFYEMIPSCARACDNYALSNDGCDIDDFGCHCWQTDVVKSMVGPCLAKSNCSTADFGAFTSVVNSVCTYENVTNAARWAAEYGTGNSTGGNRTGAAGSTPIQYRPTPTNRPALYTGGAKVLAAGTAGALGAVALAVGLVL